MMDGGDDDAARGDVYAGSTMMITGRKRKADDDNNYLDGDELGIVMGMNMHMGIAMIPLRRMHGDGNDGGDGGSGCGGSSVSAVFFGSETGEISHHVAIATDATGNDTDARGGGGGGGGDAGAGVVTTTATSSSQAVLGNDDATRLAHGYLPIAHADTFAARILALAPAPALAPALAPAQGPVEEIDDMHRRQALDWQPPKKKVMKRKIDTTTKRPGYELVKAALLRYR